MHELYLLNGNVTKRTFALLALATLPSILHRRSHRPLCQPEPHLRLAKPGYINLNSASLVVRDVQHLCLALSRQIHDLQHLHVASVIRVLVVVVIQENRLVCTSSTV